MLVVMVAILFVSRLLLASDPLGQATRPALASSDSPWNVLAYGGKGEMHGAPICHSRGRRAGVLSTTVFVLPRDSLLYFVNPPKIRLLERRAGEFCDIYQNQYAYEPTREADEASILDI